MRTFLIALLFLPALLLAQESGDSEPTTNDQPATSTQEPVAETSEETASDVKPDLETPEDDKMNMPSNI
jgi:hypothetical protein